MLGGLARRAAYLEAVRKEAGGIFLVDSGNLFFRPGSEDGPELVKTKAELVGRVYRKMNYTAVNVGNQDLQNGLKFLLNEAKAGLPLISANLLRQDRKGTVFPPYVLKTERGVKLAFVGLMTADSPPSVRKVPEPGFAVAVPVETLKRLMPALRKKADIIVLLSDLGLEADRRIAHEVKGIHFILGGREGHFSLGPLWFGGTAALQSFREGMFWGRLNLVLETTPGNFKDEGRPGVIKEALKELDSQLKMLASHLPPAGKSDDKLEQNIQNLKNRQQLLIEELRRLEAEPLVGNRLLWSMIPLEMSLPEDQETLDWIKKAGITKN